MQLTNFRINKLWYKIKSFKTLDDCNSFLEQNPDFGLLAERKTYDDKPVYVVARNDDKGQEKLNLYFESEDTGFCVQYLKVDCGRLFALIETGLHTCNDDAWREPCTPVDENLFILHHPC